MGIFTILEDTEVLVVQETAAAVGATAAGKVFQGLSGPVRAMILLNLGKPATFSLQKADPQGSRLGRASYVLQAVHCSAAIRWL